MMTLMERFHVDAPTNTFFVDALGEPIPFPVVETSSPSLNAVDGATCGLEKSTKRCLTVTTDFPLKKPHLAFVDSSETETGTDEDTNSGHHSTSWRDPDDEEPKPGDSYLDESKKKARMRGYVHKYKEAVMTLYQTIANELGLSKAKTVAKFEKDSLTALIDFIYQTIGETPPPLLELERVGDHPSLDGLPSRQRAASLSKFQAQNKRKEIKARLDVLEQVLSKQGSQYFDILHSGGRGRLKPILKAGLFFIQEHRPTETDD